MEDQGPYRMHQPAAGYSRCMEVVLLGSTTKAKHHSPFSVGGVEETALWGETKNPAVDG